MIIHTARLTCQSKLCDQGSTNRDAINRHLKETLEDHIRKQNEYKPHYGFDVNEDKIMPLFDSPHLIKLIRNHWLKKDIVFPTNNERKQGKWQHIVQLYNIDKGEAELRAVPLTDRHDIPERIPKMKVSVCTKVFSQKVASIINLVAKRCEFCLFNICLYIMRPNISVHSVGY